MMSVSGTDLAASGVQYVDRLINRWLPRGNQGRRQPHMAYLKLEAIHDIPEGFCICVGTPHHTALEESD